MGYPEETKGFKLYKLETRRFTRSRSVLFCEEEFHDFDVKVDPKRCTIFFLRDITENEQSDDENELPLALEHQKVLEVVYCPTDEMIADVMTKPFSKDKFERFRSLLGVVDI